MSRSRNLLCQTTTSKNLRNKLFFAVSATLSVFLFASVFACDPQRSYADAIVPNERQEGTANESSEAAFQLDGLVVGVDGIYKNGFQTQVALTWSVAAESAQVARVELETIDSDGTPFLASYPLTDAQAQAGRLEASFIFPKSNGALTVRLIGTDELRVEKTFKPGESREDAEGTEEGPKFVFPTPSSPSKPLYVVVGDDKLGFNEAFAELRWKEERRPNVVRISDVHKLPVDFSSFEAIDKIFISTSDVTPFEGAAATTAQIVAMKKWVERGGSVTLLADEHAIPLLSEGGALSPFCPGSTVAEKAQEFRSVNAFITDLQNVKNLAMTGSRSNPYLRTPVVSDLKSDVRVEMQEVETPLLTVQPVGLGTVVYFASDISQAPIANWSGRGRLLLKIMGVDIDRVNAGGASTFVKRGYLDLSGQIRSALDQFDGVKIVQFSLVAIVLFIYLLAIAPLDWFFVKKVVKKPNLTWGTFPLLIVLFCVVAVCVIRSSTPKDRALLNQVDLIDVDMASGMTRDVSWFGFYSSTGARYDLDFGAGKLTTGEETALTLDDSETTSVLTPLTLSGEGIGGAEQKTYVTRVWDEPYQATFDGVSGKLTGTPLATRSSKSFVGRWTSRMKGLPELPTLQDDGLVLHGSVVNPFDVPIYSAYLIYEGGAYSLGTLAPGETAIERGMTRLEPMRVLNEHQSSVPTDKQKTWDTTVYNSASTRLPYILRTASFYDFGGGEENFGIAKRLQSDVDLSALLRCGRGVVFGTIVDPFNEEYRPSDDLARRSADALELDRLNKKLAEQRGETVERASELALERYGAYGTSDDFSPTCASWKCGTDDTGSASGTASRRTVVVRLVVPMTHGSSSTQP